ncbi:MAG: 1-deoxy-D-xylulose-5-phosphate synthase [Chlamydiae bacterium]|nr:1-deoxy-D-xylulose-5-phosphate synthase [Chlamydiota bacterium]
MSVAQKSALSNALSHAKALKTLEYCYLTRFSDLKMAKLGKQNKGGAFHMSAQGHELVGAIAALELISGKDWGLPYYRDQAFPLALGCDLLDIIGVFLGRNCKHQSSGRMMPYHYSHRDLRIICQSSPVGSQYLQAVGRALGIKRKGEAEVVYVSGGEGSTSQGDFHEAMNFACIHKLPVVFMIQDNGWAISVPVEEQTAGGSILGVAKGYEGMGVFEVDGTDYSDTQNAMHKAVLKARSNEGPSVIVAKIPRLGAHSNSDDPNKYRDKESLEQDIKNDPVAIFESYLIDNNIITEQELNQVKVKAEALVEEKALAAEELPHPTAESTQDFVFTPFEIEEMPDNVSDQEVVMMDAINHALQEELERDPQTYIFGQDVAGGKGGVFGLTRGLTDKFSKNRCFNSPLAESTIVGMSLGLSAGGEQKAISEIQFSDYIWTGMNQLVNEIASFQWRSNGEWTLPLVIRIPCGGYIQGGPYHSQSLEAYLSHCPGLKVVIPSNAYDAKALLKAAIRDPNPVVFLEHKLLYRQRAFSARKEPDENFLLPLGKAMVTHEGDDITVVSWSYCLVMAHEVAERLSRDGHSVEVIDLRTIVPLDKDAILNSVKKTGKLLIIHEDTKNGGFGAEISAMVNEEIFDYLDAPIQRVCGLNTPVGYSKVLENTTLPQKEDIEKAMVKLINY